MEPKEQKKWCEEEKKCWKLGSVVIFYLLKFEATKNKDECKSGKLAREDVFGRLESFS